MPSEQGQGQLWRMSGRKTRCLWAGNTGLGLLPLPVLLLVPSRRPLGEPGLPAQQDPAQNMIRLGAGETTSGIPGFPDDAQVHMDSDHTQLCHDPPVAPQQVPSGKGQGGETEEAGRGHLWAADGAQKAAAPAGAYTGAQQHPDPMRRRGQIPEGAGHTHPQLGSRLSAQSHTHSPAPQREAS